MKTISMLLAAATAIAFGVQASPLANASITTYGSCIQCSEAASSGDLVAFKTFRGYDFWGQWVEHSTIVTSGTTAFATGGPAPTGTFIDIGPPRVSGSRPAIPQVGSGVPSDFNNNGIVDAADYILWRNGGPQPLYNDPTFGVQPEDYDAWRTNFGGSVNPADTIRLAFHGTYGDPQQTGIFVKRGGQITTIAKSGDLMPGTASPIVGLGSDLAIHGATVAFGATAENGAEGIFTGNGGALTTIAQTGDMTSLGPLKKITFSPAISGNTVTFAATAGDNDTMGIFAGNAGEITTLFKLGDPAPVGVFTDFDEAGISMGSGGKIAFRATYDGGNKTGIFTTDGNTLTTVVTSDTHSGLSIPSMSGNEVAFVAGGEIFKRNAFGQIVTIASRSELSQYLGPHGPGGIGRFAFSGNKLAFSFFVPVHCGYGIGIVDTHSPEPSTLTLLSLALVAAGGLTRRRRRDPVFARPAPAAQREFELSRRVFATLSTCAGLLIGVAALPARAADLIHASAYLGSTGVTDNYGLNSAYLGSRFSVPSVTHVEAVGGHLGGLEGDLFAAIVSLEGPIALPSGSPFNSSTIATTVFSAPNPSDDILVPLSTTLNPGNYALIFGSGQFGAEGNGGMPTNNVDFPGRASYFRWPGNYGQYWSYYNGGGLRFVVMGTAEPAPQPPYQAEVFKSPGFASSFANNNSGTARVGVGYTGPTGPTQRHALLWQNSTDNAINLQPAGFAYSEAEAVDGNTQVGTAFNDPYSGDTHAMLWHGSAESAVDLHPAGFQRSWVYGIVGNTQFGVAINEEWMVHYTTHAFLWHGTAESAVDLNPAGFKSSDLRAITKYSQVGSGVTNDDQGHALLWRGTPESAVDLHPAGFKNSGAVGVSGEFQVGSGETLEGQRHALMWHGTPESVVDLHPAGFSSSSADFISGDTQVGSGTPASGRTHALLWRGTAESVVDLNPAGFSESHVNDVDGNRQVGHATAYYPEDRSLTHAMYWNGTAESAIDLHQYLAISGNGYVYSTATAIAANGDIVGRVNYNVGTTTYISSVLWKPVLEPVAGDYDGNGTVDAADYVVWRNTLGDTGTELVADGNGNGEIDAADYDVWRAHFGQSAANTFQATTTFSEAIPEPSSITLLVGAAVFAVMFNCKRALKSSVPRGRLQSNSKRCVRIFSSFSDAANGISYRAMLYSSRD